MKKTMVAMFFSAMLLLPALSFSSVVENVPLRFESMGIQIFTVDDTLPKEYFSLSLLSASGKEFFNILQDISEEARKLKGDGIIILSMEKNGQEFTVFAKVIKVK